MFTLYLAEGKSLEEIEAEDKEEEEEATKIQKRLAAKLSEEDYDLNLLEVLYFIYLFIKGTGRVRMFPSFCSVFVIFLWFIRSLLWTLKWRRRWKKRKGL